MGMCVIHGPRVLHQDGEEEEEEQQQQEEESLPRRDDHSSGFKPHCNNNAKGGGAVAVVEANEREEEEGEEERRRNNYGSVGPPLEHHHQHPALWKRRILRGERCEPLAFSGLILYDEHGNRVGGNHMNRCYGARPSTCLQKLKTLDDKACSL